MFDMSSCFLEGLFVSLKHPSDVLLDVNKLKGLIKVLIFFLNCFLMKDLIVIFNTDFFIIAFGKLDIQQTDYRLIIVQALKLALHLGILK
jgi:hypothetical protein